MRTLKSIGLVVAGGLYAFLIFKMPSWMTGWFLGLIFVGVLFCWGYFVLFKPKR